jgi:hypothetical protein
MFWSKLIRNQMLSAMLQYAAKTHAPHEWYFFSEDFKVHHMFAYFNLATWADYAIGKLNIFVRSCALTYANYVILMNLIQQEIFS